MTDDSLLWCEDCGRSLSGECQLHGALIRVEDRPTPSHARLTLPSILVLKSQSAEDGTIVAAIFAKKFVERRTQFGPLLAPILTPTSSRPKGLVFKIFTEGKKTQTLDLRNEAQCNWMMFVRPAKYREEQNLVAYQHCGAIYFASVKAIAPNVELRVWYAKDYGLLLKARQLIRESARPRKAARKHQPKGRKQATRSSSSSSSQSSWTCLHCSAQFSSHSDKRCHMCPSISVGMVTRSRDRQQKINLSSRRHKTGKGGEQKKKGMRANKKVERIVKGGKGIGVYVPGPTVEPIIDVGKAQSSIATRTSASSERVASHCCPHCSKAFVSGGKLQQHLFVHSGERPFHCTSCSKSFSSKFKLMRHSLIHSSERKFCCPYCERCFHRKDHLKNHLQVHNPNKKVHRCEQCSKEYNSRLSFRKHIAVHAAEAGDLNCKVCGKTFATSAEILYHLKVHAGSRTIKSPHEKKFQCDFCERRFFTRKDVKRHLVVHTGRRDFLCQFCPQRFGRKDHLVRHIKKSHNSAAGLASSDSPDKLGGTPAVAESGPSYEASSSTTSTRPVFIPPPSFSQHKADVKPESSHGSLLYGASSSSSSASDFRAFDDIKVERTDELLEPLSSGSFDLGQLLGFVPMSPGPGTLPVQSLPPLLPLNQSVLPALTPLNQEQPTPTSNTPLPRFSQAFH